VETAKLITVYRTKLKFILSRNKQRASLPWGQGYFASTSTQANIQPRRTLKYFGEVLYIRPRILWRNLLIRWLLSLCSVG